ncbi:MAG: UbiD family decarboxylase [Planctomycetaceae bacterium]|nr:MAG: UbiD family decarboxylase [Planctomycetaceae bacterium]
MGYRSLQQCVRDLESSGHLVQIDDPIDANLEAAEIHRRVFASQGPAILLTNVTGCPFPMVSNLFGTIDRARYLFRDTLEGVRRLIELKIDPPQLMRRPWRYATSLRYALAMLPKRCRRGPVLAGTTQISQLPMLKSWPDDGGAFVTLPQVYTEHVDMPGLMKSNLGMYRIQLSGGQYQPDREIGLHYQLHRSIGVHHAAAVRSGQPFRVNIFVGGTPAMTLAAVMPLPEGMSELTFAGALAGHRIPMIVGQRAEDASGKPVDLLPIYGEADFCISGTVDPQRQLPEGPFGDHLGYYSLAHDFPVLKVHRVYHRRDAIWPFTVVGRPPQEDTMFGQLIHELTGPIIPTVIPGVRAVHAVDAAGVHPLLLAVGSERYTPYNALRCPQELLTQANAILGQGQLSLAKYLLIVAGQDDDTVDIHDIGGFFAYLLQRVDWTRDLHFQTRTTIDTLDYSGSDINQGSKLVIAAAGPAVRELPTELTGIESLPDGFDHPQLCLPGVLAVQGPACTTGQPDADPDMQRFCRHFPTDHTINRYPLVVVVDDSRFTAASLKNFLWVVFTRSNPAADVYGIASFTEQKHWGSRGSLVIDARIKPHHAPPLIEDTQVTKKVDALAARGGPLARYL